MNSMFVPGMDIRFFKKNTLTLYCGNVVTRLYSSVPNLYHYIYYQTILLVYPVSLLALSYIRELYLLADRVQTRDGKSSHIISFISSYNNIRFLF